MAFWQNSTKLARIVPLEHHLGAVYVYDEAQAILPRLYLARKGALLAADRNRDVDFLIHAVNYGAVAMNEQSGSKMLHPGQNKETSGFDPEVTPWLG